MTKYVTNDLYTTFILIFKKLSHAQSYFTWYHSRYWPLIDINQIVWIHDYGFKNYSKNYVSTPQL